MVNPEIKKNNQSTSSLGKSIISINDYRCILGDDSSSDDLIKKRLEYVEVFCRTIIKNEIKKYVEKSKTTKITK